MESKYPLRRELRFQGGWRRIFPLLFWLLLSGIFLFLNPKDLEAAKRPLWVSLELGLLRASSATLNDELIPLLNQILSDLEAEAKDLGFKTSFSPMGKINTSLSAAVEVETPVWNQFSLVAGIGYWKRSVFASVEASGELNNFFYGLEDSTGVSMRLIPVRVSVRGEKMRGFWRYFGGVGLTWALAQFEYTSRIQFLDLMGSLEEDYFREKARGRAILPHAEAGVDYTWREKFRFGVIIRIPIGKISKLKIVDSSDPQDLGEEAVFIDQWGREQFLSWELTGFQASLVVRYLF